MCNETNEKIALLAEALTNVLTVVQHLADRQGYPRYPIKIHFESGKVVETEGDYESRLRDHKRELNRLF